MTPDAYFAVLKAMGIVPAKPPYQRRILCSTRDGDYIQVPDPAQLSPEEREEAIDLVKWRLGITDH
ncbi:MAG: hypothetical protein GVY13_15435 [Alphaproteobacteria bacterium]|nr:hypothetical protein [Alphaproteobacteria bacterium]